MGEFNGPRPAYCLELARGYMAAYPDNYPGWLVLANALWDLSRFTEARTCLVRALRLTPDAHRHFVLVQVGHFRTAQGQYRKAARWYRRAVSDSGDVAYHVFVGGAFARLGELDEAESWHRAGIACSDGPRDEAFYNLGLILRAKERYVEALEAFDQALELDPDYTVAKQARDDVLKAAQASTGVRLFDD